MATKVINSLTFGDTYVFTTPYGTSPTAADTVAKVATVSSNSNFALEAGVRVIVKFTYANTASSPTLNVNNSGAKTIQFRGAAITSSLYRWAANSVVEFMYDGTYWQMLGAPNNTNSTYTVNDKKITLSAGTGLSGGGDFTLNQSSDETISFALADSGVTATSYGPSANATPAHSGTFSVPYITVDRYGRVTAASTKTITLPASGNTDQKVKQTKSTTTSYRAMLLGTTYSSTLGDLDTEETGQAYKTSNIVACPSTGEIKATKFTGALDGNAKTATSANKVNASLTFNNGGGGVGSGTTFDGSTARTISYNTIGAAASSHTHTTSLATDSGTSSVTLAHGGKYKLTAGGTSVIFTMPAYVAGSGIRFDNTAIMNDGVTSIQDDCTVEGSNISRSLDTAQGDSSIGIKLYTASRTNLTAGSSELPTGHIHIVYE